MTLLIQGLGEVFNATGPVVQVDEMELALSVENRVAAEDLQPESLGGRKGAAVRPAGVLPAEPATR